MGQLGFVGRAILPAAGFQPAHNPVGFLLSSAVKGSRPHAVPDQYRFRPHRNPRLRALPRIPLRTRTSAAWPNTSASIARRSRIPPKFWAEIASELHWFKPWDQVLEWNCPWAKWFSGGQINLSYNCLDRHVATWRRNKAALIWEGEPGEVQTLTYQQLLTEVSKFANVLKSLGVQKGDRVAIYMGMCPALPIAMLACARIGAPHTVIFGGFSSQRAGRSHHGFAGLAGHHPGRLLPARRRSEIEARRR